MSLLLHGQELLSTECHRLRLSSVDSGDVASPSWTGIPEHRVSQATSEFCG